MGRRVKSPYGRHLGFVVGLITDPLGKTVAMGLDGGEAGYLELPVEGAVLENDVVIVRPAWRIAADEVSEEMKAIGRRRTAVEELRHEGELSQEESEAASRSYQSRMENLGARWKDLQASVEARMKALDQEMARLNGLMTNVKLQHKSGEIGDESFRVSSQYINLMKERAQKERDDLEGLILRIQSGPRTLERETPDLQPVPRVQVEKPGEGPEEHGERRWLQRFLGLKEPAQRESR